MIAGIQKQQQRRSILHNSLPRRPAFPPPPSYAFAATKYKSTPPGMTFATEEKGDERSDDEESDEEEEEEEEEEEQRRYKKWRRKARPPKPRVPVSPWAGALVETTLQDAVQELSNVSEPLLSAVHLLATSLQLPWKTGYRDVLHLYENKTPDDPTLVQRRLTCREANAFRALVNRRLKHEPIQYLCGQWDFLDYTLRVRAPLLCPRPETEELVLLALEDARNMPKRDLHILDIGCGTGCIGIAMADKVPEAKVTAIDIDLIAVGTSLENAARIGVLSRYEAGLCAIEEFEPPEDVLYDMVVCNPPYIPADDMAGLQPDVRNFESHDALAGGGADGLDLIRDIVAKLPDICPAGAICWMEVDPSQPNLLREWLETENTGPSSYPAARQPVRFVCSKMDLFGQERFVKLQVRVSRM